MTLETRGIAASPVRRRMRAGLVIATLALVGGSLTACSGTGGTTCGEFTDQDESAQRETMNSLIEESDDDTVKDELDAAEDKDAYLDTYIAGLTAACEGEDDGKEVGDLIYEEQ